MTVFVLDLPPGLPASALVEAANFLNAVKQNVETISNLVTL